QSLTVYSQRSWHSVLPFFFTVPPPPAIYPLSLHDALPISGSIGTAVAQPASPKPRAAVATVAAIPRNMLAFLITEPAYPCGLGRSEEHTSELQSRENLVCRLLLEKKKKKRLLI